MSKTPALQRLEELLDQKDEQIAELTEQVEQLERDMEGLEDGWSRHRNWEEKDLPVPRLEMHWSREDDRGYRTRAMTVLVYKHFTHMVPKPMIIAVPISSTTRTGGNGSFWEDDWDNPGNERLSSPMRDGCHLHHDAVQLDLPAFITTEDGDATEVVVDRKDGPMNASKHNTNKQIIIRKKHA